MFYFGRLLLNRHLPLGLCLLASTITAGCADLSVSRVYVHFSDLDAPNGPVPQVLTIGDEAQLVGHANANTSIPYVKYRSDKHPGPGTIVLTARIPWVLDQADQITAEATVVVVE